MKKVSLFFLIVIAAMVVMYYALYEVAVWQESGSVVTQDAAGERAPEFSDYFTADVYSGEPAPVDFETYPDAKAFTTRIEDGAKQGPNFAGHYTVVSWGCGTACQVSAVIDAKTGAIVEYGIPSTFDLSYTVGSDLLIINPKENVPVGVLQTAHEYPDEHYPLGTIPLVSDYYVMKDGHLEFLGQWSVLSGRPHACDPQPSPARNPITKKEATFEMPCAIPYGWDALETGEGTQ